MIAFMKGTLAGIEETKILLEHDGIGYEIFIPMDGRVDRLYTGQELMVHTYLHVREDVLQLYGFLTRDDLEIFRLLLGVNGVGPKAALGFQQMSCVLLFWQKTLRRSQKRQELEERPLKN